MNKRSASLLIITQLIFATCTRIPATGGADVVQSDFQNEPFIMVNTQIIKDNSVVVPEVLSNGPGWIVVYADDNGSPGEMLGFSPVFMGFNVDVFVKIDPEKTIPMLFAMLHEDAGQEGVFEFPGVDEPVIVSGEVVSKAFPASDPFVEPFGLPEDIGK